MRTEVRITAGLTHSGTLNLTNESTEKVRVRAELLDFSFDEAANPQFARDLPAEKAHSCRAGLMLNPMELEIEPQATAKVRYTLRAPSDAAEQSFHCAAGFTTLPPVAKAKGMGMQMAVRMVSAFYLVIGNPPIEATIRGLRLETVETKEGPTHQAVLSIENPGQAYCRPEGLLAVIGPDGKVVEEAPLPSTPVLPQRTQIVPLRLSKPMPAGDYQLRARIDFGTHEMQEAEVKVSVPGTGGKK